MGGRGSGGRRTGSGRKLQSALHRAIRGTSGPGRVITHPSSTAVAPVETFDPPAELQGTAAELANLTSQLAFLRQAAGPDEPNPQIAELEARVDELEARAQALAIWHELSAVGVRGAHVDPGDGGGVRHALPRRSWQSARCRRRRRQRPDRITAG